MALPEPESRGILAPLAFDRRLVFARTAPPPDLAEIIDAFWSVTWDLEGEPPRAQDALAFPCVNLVIGTHRPGVHGPSHGRFVAELVGRGWVLGTKLRPAGARALLRVAPRALVDTALTPEEAFTAGAVAGELERAVLASPTNEERRALVTAFLRAHHPGLDDDDREMNRLVELARTAPEIMRVSDLAERAARTPRTLERLFLSRLGVSPKWVIRRFRIQEAAAHLAPGEALDGAALAQRLGYFDQSHFIRDFKSQIGKTPLQYHRDAGG